MANKNDLFDFDETTAVNNDNVQGANVAENCAPSGINNAIRGLAAIVKRAIGSQGSAIASAATTAIGGAGTALYTTITGTTSITSLGLVGAGTFRIIEFASVVILTHNATSLKLPGGANITTAAGDVGYFISLGSGNWKCLHYSKADGSAVASFSGSLTSTDAGAAEGPTFTAFRDSASPAANDVMGALRFNGRDSGAAAETYGAILSEIVDPTAGSEDGRLRFRTRAAGADADWLLESGASYFAGLTSKGVGTLNTNGIYVAGHGTIAQVVSDTENGYITLGTILPFDDTIPQSTEGNEVLSVSITPTNANSTLRIKFSGMFGSSTGLAITAALFVDSVASALNASTCFVTAAGIASNISFEHVVTAGSTSARTYKIRAGSEVATDAFLNGDSTGRKYGGIATASLIVEEVLPQ